MKAVIVDALALILYTYEQDGNSIPMATPIADITASTNSFVTYISCDTVEYRKMYNNKAVKKTLTIPEWLNEEALHNDINFSQLLQDALKSKLNIG